MSKKLIIITTLFLICLIGLGTYLYLKNRSSADVISGSEMVLTCNTFYKFSSNSTRIFGLTLNVSGNLVNNYDLARVVLKAKDKDNKDISYLVYENMGILNQGKFKADDTGSETQILDSVTPLELVQCKTPNTTVTVDNNSIKTINSQKQLSSNLHIRLNSKSGDIVKVQEDMRLEKTQQTVNSLNNKLQSSKASWTAAVTGPAKQSHQYLVNMFGGKEENLTSNTILMLSYKEGVFDFNNPSKTTKTSTDTKVDLNYYREYSNVDSIPQRFSWSRRHGKNWDSSVKDQTSCSSCWSFAAVGSLEARTNLKYNDLIFPSNIPSATLDNHQLLSEQWAIFFKDNGCNGGRSEAVFYGLKNTNSMSIPSQQYLPYKASDDGKPIPFEVNLQNTSIAVKSHDYEVKTNVQNDDELKKILINNGPVAIVLNTLNTIEAQFIIGQIPPVRHTVVLVGYETDPVDNRTIWIGKNSYGDAWGSFGYIYFKIDISKIYNVTYSTNPQIIVSEPYTICEDKDGDGYYNWGIGSKPSTCPTGIPDREDWDDSIKGLVSLDQPFVIYEPINTRLQEGQTTKIRARFNIQNYPKPAISRIEFYANDTKIEGHLAGASIYSTVPFPDGSANTAVMSFYSNNFQVPPSSPGLKIKAVAYDKQGNSISSPEVFVGVINTSPAIVNDSQITAQPSISSTLVVGQLYTVTVKIRNNGTTTWTKQAGYKLGAVYNNDYLGISNVELDTNDSIAPGAEKLFSFNIRPKAPGTQKLQYRMTQGSNSFGEATSPKDLTINYAPVLKNSAEAIIQSAPNAQEILYAGQSYPVKVRVKNIGTTTWTKKDLYRLGAVGDNNNFNMGRVELANGDKIAPGQEKTFSFYIYPKVTGIQKLQYQMLQEYKEWFGAATKELTYTVKNKPVCKWNWFCSWVQRLTKQRSWWGWIFYWIPQQTCKWVFQCK